MNCLTRFARPLVGLFALLVILSSCQKEQHKDLLDTPSPLTVETSTLTDLSDGLDASDIIDIQLIGATDIAIEEQFRSFKTEINTKNGDCPYKECQLTVEDIKKSFQALADKLCKDILVELVCCQDGEVVRTFIKIKSNCSTEDDIVIQYVIEG